MKFKTGAKVLSKHSISFQENLKNILYSKSTKFVFTTLAFNIIFKVFFPPCIRIYVKFSFPTYFCLATGTMLLIWVNLPGGRITRHNYGNERH
jgi:hypothetical protein